LAGTSFAGWTTASARQRCKRCTTPSSADLTDRTLFVVDLDAAKLASRLRAGQPRAKTAAGLGEVGGAF
jgi:hypothetical protein